MSNVLQYFAISLRKRGVATTAKKVARAFFNTLRHPLLNLRIVSVCARAGILFRGEFLERLIKLHNGAYSRHFDFRERSRVFLHHFEFAHHNVPPQFRLGRSGARQDLWSLDVLDGRLSAVLHIPSLALSQEGELVVSLFFDAREIATCGFQFCEGAIFGESGTVIFVSRMQGVRNTYDIVKPLNKALGHMHLSKLLVSVIEGVALAHGVHCLVGVDGATQLAANDHKDYTSMYDRPWQDHGAVPIVPGYHALSLPLDHTVQGQGKCHPNHSRRRHELRRAITSAVRESVAGMRAVKS